MPRPELEFLQASLFRKLMPACFAISTLASVPIHQGCTAKDPDPERLVTQESGDRHEVISWFEGDVAEAFELAKAQGKPLFLYWGAEWCPPCHYLKDKLFTRPEFIERMAGFVPVYLDGDTERAQIWGEELAVKGYPTVIVFDSTGQEVMRMPSTLPVDQYQQVLDSAMRSTRSVQAMLDDVMSSGPSSAEVSDLEILAFYSWSQDSSIGLGPSERMSVFRRLFDESPADLDIVRSRFLTHYLIAASEAHRQSSEAGDTAPLPAAELEALRTEATRILSSDTLRSDNLVWLLYYSTDTLELLAPEPGEEQSKLIAAWQAAAAAIEGDPTLTINDRLSALLPQIALSRFAAEAESTAERGEPWVASVEIQQHVRDRVSWAMDEVSEDGELQTTMNTVASLLSSVGLENEAEALLTARMDDATAPYYFMSWMGSLKEDAGETEEALAWYRRAYESSTGRYSRFRWGSMYLRHLLELAPDDALTIEDHSKEVLNELLALDDAFAGGNHSRLQGLERSYLEWNDSGEHSATIGNLRDYVLGACGRFPDDGNDSQQARCSSFLADDDPSKS